MPPSPPLLGQQELCQLMRLAAQEERRLAAEEERRHHRVRFKVGSFQ